MKTVDEITANVLDLAMEIQQIPAPTYAEARRAAFIREKFIACGLSDVFMDELSNVFARKPGSGLASPVVFSAHLDTVFPASTRLTIRREEDRIYGPGIGDNSLGVAGLFGILELLGSHFLPGDIWFIANVGEEGLGNLRGMKAVVERLGSQTQAFVVVEGMSLGHVYHRGLGVRRYLVKVNTPGGHSWVNYGSPSAIHELARLITQLTSLSLPSDPRTTLNIGTITGGTSINTIASEAQFELDLRSESSSGLQALVAEFENMAYEFRQSGPGFIDVQVESIGERPFGQISTEHPLVKLALRCLEAQGITPDLSIGSTDANVPLAMGLPAVCMGITTGARAHTVDEYIHTQPVALGLSSLAALAEALFS